MGEKGCAERKRGKLRQKEWKKNPGGAFNDGLTRGMVGSLVDLVGAVSWKVTGVFIIILIVVLVVVTIF
ncbi:hypothetical protein FZC74_17640 [Sutcliffiella horikoshii]|uniref:Phage capsid protein n=1 Tax=Sutcliffiella horikoshii TaxID=79883 RepID=A0AA94WK27_9BACI|nr:DUF6366 family protein [Sutcliffiella horikoshii]TYS55882.1 hypothetical protein FZC74_17640 [Sutcliffiella horikoshii]